MSEIVEALDKVRSLRREMDEHTKAARHHNQAAYRLEIELRDASNALAVITEREINRCRP